MNNQNATAGNTSAINLEYLYNLAEGNFEFVAEMITLFLESVPPAILEIEHALETSNWDKIRATAHRIRPSFGFIGAHPAQDILQQMERNAHEAPDNILQKTLFKQLNGILNNCLPELEAELNKKK